MTTEAPRKPRPSLGRGLNALLGDIAPEAVPTSGGGETPSGIRMLPVGALTTVMPARVAARLPVS